MTFGLFLSLAAVHLLAAISPGPSFVVILRVAAAEGRTSALLVALGFGVGAVLWAFAALAGLTLLFEIVPAALLALKYAGALFLLFIALMLWRKADAPAAETPANQAPRSLTAAFRLGLLTQLANPKVAIFFGAVFAGLLPPNLSLSSIAMVLASVLVVETAWYVLVALVFSRPLARQAYLRARRVTDRVFGTLIAAFGAKIALT